MKAATCTHGINTITLKFQSTPPVKAATCYGAAEFRHGGISIHAAREGGDVLFSFFCRPPSGFQSTPPVKAATRIPCVFVGQLVISIHAAREGGDLAIIQLRHAGSTFQSTPPVKAATFNFGTRCVDLNISIHAAREGGDAVKRWGSAPATISIHAAREGGDGRFDLMPLKVMGFQSTPPVKAATLAAAEQVLRGAFQSTPPVKAATRLNQRDVSPLRISIHAAREGGDTQTP